MRPSYAQSKSNNFKIDEFRCLRIVIRVTVSLQTERKSLAKNKIMITGSDLHGVASNACKKDQ